MKSSTVLGRFRRLYENWIFGKRIAALSYGAEAFLVRCILIADDYGNFPADPLMLIAKAGGLRQYTNEEVTDWIKEFESKGLMRLYLVDSSDWYGHIIGFVKTQPPTGAPRGASLGRKKMYPESPWDTDEMQIATLERDVIQSTKFPDSKVLFVQRAKESTPCHDCGLSFPYYLMDFDHRPGETKLFNLSECARYSLEEIKTEMRKCDAVCSQCHRKRTHTRSSEGGGPSRLSDEQHKDNDHDKDEKENIYAVRGMDKRVYVLRGFAYWQTKLQHPNAKLSPERVRLLEARWKDSTFNELQLAIDGCESSDFHMGRQPNNPVRYDEITLICRTRSKLEWFASKVEHRKKGTDDKKHRSNEAERRWKGQ